LTVLKLFTCLKTNKGGQLYPPLQLVFFPLIELLALEL